MPAYQSRHNQSRLPANVTSGRMSRAEFSEWRESQERWEDIFYLVGENFPDMEPGDELPESEWFWLVSGFSSKGAVFRRKGDAEYEILLLKVKKEIEVELRIAHCRYQPQNSSYKEFVGWC